MIDVPPIGTENFGSKRSSITHAPLSPIHRSNLFEERAVEVGIDENRFGIQRHSNPIIP